MIAILLLLHVAAPAYTEVRCDVMELNHYYDEQGRHVFDQLIGWEWHDSSCRHHVEWFKLRQDSKMNGPYEINGGYEATFCVNHKWYRARSGSYRETWTQQDVELMDRGLFPKDMRLDLPK